MSGWLLAQADARRLPLADQSVDLVFGSIPIVGDISDLFFKANSKNLTLLKSHMNAEIGEVIDS